MAWQAKGTIDCGISVRTMRAVALGWSILEIVLHERHSVQANLLSAQFDLCCST
jgi:hypothetical protein